MATPEAVLDAHIIWQDAGLAMAGGWPDEDTMLRRCKLRSAMLFDLDDQKFTDIALAWVQAGNRWAPSVGELREMRGGDPTESWEAGWDLMLRKVNLYNPPEQHTDNVDQERAIRAGIQAIGGYRTMCQMEVGDPAARAAFRDAYNRIMHAAELDRAHRRSALVQQVVAGHLTERQAREEFDPTRPALRLVQDP